MFSKIKLLWAGIIAGALVSLVFGLVYFVVLQEPGSAFYLFAGLTFLGGSLIGGMIAGFKTREHRLKTFLIASAAVFGGVPITHRFQPRYILSARPATKSFRA